MSESEIFAHETRPHITHSSYEHTSQRPVLPTKSDRPHRAASKTHRVHSRSRLARIGSAIGGLIDPSFGADDGASMGGNTVDGESDSTSDSDSDSDSSSASTQKKHRKGNHTHGTLHHQHQRRSDATPSRHNDSEEDDQHRRPSWSDHIESCESCAKLPTISSSIPSTVGLPGDSTTWQSEYSSERTGFTFDTMAKFKDGTVAEVTDLSAGANRSFEHRNAESVSEQSRYPHDAMSQSNPRHTIIFRKTDGTIMQIDGTTLAINQCNQQVHLSPVPLSPTIETSSSHPTARKSHRTSKTTRRGSRHQVQSGDSDQIISSEQSKTYEKGIEPEITMVPSEEEDLERTEDFGNLRPKAQTLMRRTGRFVQIITWMIMIIVPLVFIALAILNAVIDGKSLEGSSLGQGVSQANRVAITIWPIVFAAMLSQSLKLYATYKAERGIALMTLEQLIGSHSVASAIKQPFIFRRLSWVTLVLLCLWSLSPLAGQAFLRVSISGSKNSTSIYPLEYIDLSAKSAVFGTGKDNASDVNYFTDGAPNVNLLFGSSIIGSDIAQNGGSDPWNNAKIPIIEKLLSEDNTTNSGAWRTVDPMSSPPYSSLLGVPVVNPIVIENSSITLDFQAQSSYFLLNCLSFEVFTGDQYEAAVHAANLTLYNSTSGTLAFALLPAQDGNLGSLIFASSIPTIDTEEGSRFYTNCTIDQTFVESQISCSVTGCGVSGIRNSLTPGTSTSTVRAFQDMLQDLAAFGSSNATGKYTPIELFLNDTTQADQYTTALDLSQVPPQDFTDRLTLLFNTYWQAGVAPFDFAGDGHGSGIPTNIGGNVTLTTTTDVFLVSWPWLAVALFSSVLLLVAGIAGAIWDSRTVGPNVFGFASSLLPRDKCMRLNGGGGAIGGSARARALRDTRVMLQDVRPGRRVGRIALARVESNGERLKLGRMYK